MTMQRRLPVLALLLAMLSPAAMAQDDAWPTQTVRLIAPSGPGGNPDVLARLLADKFSAKFGTPFIVENVPGAGGIVAAKMVAKARPDGHVLMFGDSGSMAINPALNPNLGYDPIKDFAPVTALVALPTIMSATPNVPAATLDAFIALAKKEPGKMNYGSAGAGSIHHLTMAIFAERTGIELLHVPYRGGSAMVHGLLTGEIEVGWSGIPNVMELIGSGQLRGYCVSVLARSPSTPAIPTCDELGQRALTSRPSWAAGARGHAGADHRPPAGGSRGDHARARDGGADAAARHGDGGEWHRELRRVHAARHRALRAGGDEAASLGRQVKARP
jgi:tripartite-type tricarboxylate transporter receptor subunit TctC